MSDYHVAKLLREGKYINQLETKRDILGVINLYPNLKPKLEKVTLPTSVRRELVILAGTIPVNYRGQYYHTPVALWIPHNYPDSAPICWVCPTKDMLIKAGKQVDTDGRVYLPYLSEWRSGSSDLLGVIQVMIILFGEEPPLFTKPKNEPPPPVTTTTAYPPYPITSTNYYPPVPRPTVNYPYSKMNNQTLSKSEMRASLMTACTDKIRNRRLEFEAQYKAEIDVLRSTNDDLKKGRQQLEKIVEEIDRKTLITVTCQADLNEKLKKLNELSENVDKVHENLDDCFGPVEPLYRQLFNAFVEENSIIDTIFYLSEALKKEVFDLDVFLKHIRELSRRQFMVRALIKKCREKANLPS